MTSVITFSKRTSVVSWLNTWGTGVVVLSIVYKDEQYEVFYKTKDYHTEQQIIAASMCMA
jgi:hypothetical protein